MIVAKGESLIVGAGYADAGEMDCGRAVGDQTEAGRGGARHEGQAGQVDGVTWTKCRDRRTETVAGERNVLDSERLGQIGAKDEPARYRIAGIEVERSARDRDRARELTGPC